MLRRVETGKEAVRFTFEGREIQAFKGETVAGALMAAGIREFRLSYVNNQPRGPYCLMGACFECIVKVNGALNVQACMIEAVAGMDVRRMPTTSTELR